eukprot:7367559-Alexandrium_andersonii.AAC.1
MSFGYTIHLWKDKAKFVRMVGEMVRIRQEIACGLPMVCRGRLGNPTLGPLDEPVRAEDPDETGRRAPLMYADWTP